MGPFKWPDTRHDIALAIEVATSNPVKPHDWEAIAGRLSTAVSTDLTQVELKARGCRERMDRLLEKFKVEDAKALKRFNFFNVYHCNPIFNTHDVNILYILVECLAILHLDQAQRRNMEN